MLTVEQAQDTSVFVYDQGQNKCPLPVDYNLGEDGIKIKFPIGCRVDFTKYIKEMAAKSGIDITPEQIASLASQFGIYNRERDGDYYTPSQEKGLWGDVHGFELDLPKAFKTDDVAISLGLDASGNRVVISAPEMDFVNQADSMSEAATDAPIPKIEPTQIVISVLPPPESKSDNPSAGQEITNPFSGLIESTNNVVNNIKKPKNWVIPGLTSFLFLVAYIYAKLGKGHRVHSRSAQSMPSGSGKSDSSYPLSSDDTSYYEPYVNARINQGFELNDKGESVYPGTNLNAKDVNRIVKNYLDEVYGDGFMSHRTTKEELIIVSFCRGQQPSSDFAQRLQRAQEVDKATAKIEENIDILSPEEKNHLVNTVLRPVEGEKSRVLSGQFGKMDLKHYVQKAEEIVAKSKLEGSEPAPIRDLRTKLEIEIEQLEKGDDRRLREFVNEQKAMVEGRSVADVVYENRLQREIQLGRIVEVIPTDVDDDNAVG